MRGFLTTLDTLNGLYLDDNLIATGLLQATAITELPNTENRKILRIVDVLGRNTPFKKNTPLFYLYDDGGLGEKNCC
jgi:hypothetical protein